MRHTNIIEDTFPDSENVRNDVEHFFRSRLVYHTHSQSITLSGVCSTSVSKHQFDLLRYHIFGQNVAKLLPNCKPANLYTLKIRGVICLEYTKKRKQLSWQSRNRGCIKTVNISSLIPLSCLCFVCVTSKTRGGTSMWVMWDSSDLVIASLKAVHQEFWSHLGWFWRNATNFSCQISYSLGALGEILIQKRSQFRL